MRIPRSSSRPMSTRATSPSSWTRSGRPRASTGSAAASMRRSRADSHALNFSMFNLAGGYQKKGLTAYAELQDAESDAKAEGYRAFEHQTFVGTAYFDEIAQVITGGDASTLAMAGSTQKEQFLEAAAKVEPVESPPRRLNATETG